MVYLNHYYTARFVDFRWVEIAMVTVLAAVFPAIAFEMAAMIFLFTAYWYQEAGWQERGECIKISADFHGKGISPYRGGYCR